MDHLITKKWIVPTSHRNSSDSVPLSTLTSSQPNVNALPKTLISSSYKIDLLAKKDSNPSSTHEYRNVTINGKTISVKVMKISPEGSLSTVQIGTKSRCDLSQKNQETAIKRRTTLVNSSEIFRTNIVPNKSSRETSSLKLNLFTAKCAEFKVLPKSTGIVDNVNSKVDEESEVATTDVRFDDENDVRAELKEIRKIQQETLAYVKRMSEKEDEYRRALAFPVATLEELCELESALSKARFRNKLIPMLKKRIARINKDTVADLMTFIFTPDVLFHYNVTGIKKKSFNDLRINQILKDVTDLHPTIYNYQLTKAIHKMHMRYSRKSNKENGDKGSTVLLIN